MDFGPAARRRATGVALAAAAALGSLTACADRPPAGAVVVRIAPSTDPTALEVRLAGAHGSFRAVHSMRPGQTRRFAVPRGWLTVRIPGVCVVPTPNSGVTTVEVRHGDCTVA